MGENTSTETKAVQAVPGQYLTFNLKAQRYGVPISTVREINRVSDITHVPQAPEFVVGVINLRGKVIPVVDLRLKFGMETAAHSRETCIIVIDGTDGQIGMIVDSVSEVVDLTGPQIEPPPVLGNDAKLSHVMGMGKIENKIIILVDIIRALSKDNLQRFAEVSKNEVAGAEKDRLKTA